MRRISGRKGVLVVVLALFFLPFGVPRFLNRDSAPDGSQAAAAFAKLCRDHGGTPAAGPRSAGTQAEPVCTVRYGGRVYRMDAITSRGFDADTARFQRQGCEEAQRQQNASTGRGKSRRSFIYHPDTGVCEHRQ